MIEAEDWWALLPLCLISITLLGYLIVKSLRSTPAGLLFETGVYFAAASALYFAFGPLLYVFGPVESALVSRAFYPVDAADSVWLTGTNFIGLGVAGSVYVSIGTRWMSRLSALTSASWSKVSPTTVFVLLLLVGVSVKYLVVEPYDLGMSGLVPSGAARQLGRLIVVAMIVGLSLGRLGPWWAKPVVAILLVLEVATGILLFNKSDALLAVMAWGIGNYWVKRSLTELAIVVACAAALYVVIKPITTFGRNEIAYHSGGDVIPASFKDRFDIINSYFRGGESHQREVERSGDWWDRLNYLPPQQAALDLKKRGNGGDDVSRFAWTFVPRIIYPDKPVMTVAGRNLNEKVRGHTTGAVGVGVFVDGYYNFGWIGVLLASMSYGWVLRSYTSVAEQVVRYRAIIMYPLVFMGLYTGLRVDGWWLSDVVGQFVYAGVGFMLFCLGRFFFNRT